jgi:hypothetical protein
VTADVSKEHVVFKGSKPIKNEKSKGRGLLSERRSVTMLKTTIANRAIADTAATIAMPVQRRRALSS